MRAAVAAVAVAVLLLAALFPTLMTSALGSQSEPQPLPARSDDPLYQTALPENVPIDAAAMRERRAGDRWYIVTIKDDAIDPRTLTSKAGRIGPRPPIGFVYRRALNGFSTRLTDAQVNLLREDSRVLSVSPNREIKPYQQTIPVGISRIEDSPASKNSTADIDGNDQRVDVGVGVIDSAVDASHPDLNVASVYDCTGETSIVPGNHGTHVAGTIGALDNGVGVVGVAPGAPIHSVKVFPNAGGSGTWDMVICALNRVAQNPSRTPVINMSLGSDDLGYNVDDGNCGKTDGDPLHQAICAVVDLGVTVVVAAGNDCGDASTYVPAGYREVMTVASFFDYTGDPTAYTGGYLSNICDGATVKTWDETISGFSNWGPDIDIIAPGSYIYSTLPNNSYGYMSGTSMASPHAAGAAALYIAKYGAIGPAAVQSGLIDRREQKTLPTNWTTGGKPASMNQGILNVNDAGPWGQPLPNATPTNTPAPTRTPAPTATPRPTATATAVPRDTTKPTVKITAPKTNSSVQSPVTIKATASDTGSGIAKVAIYSCTGDTCKLLKSDASAPYSFKLKLTPGKYDLIAKATDKAGNVGQSKHVKITVKKETTRLGSASGRSGTVYPDPVDAALRP